MILPWILRLKVQVICVILSLIIHTFSSPDLVLDMHVDSIFYTTLMTLPQMCKRLKVQGKFVSLSLIVRTFSSDRVSPLPMSAQYSLTVQNRGLKQQSFHFISSQRDEHHRASGGHSQRLQNGDVYITRHSNLAEAHVVFHLVTDDSVRTAGSGTSTSAELSSRHPVILAYRNVLKACFRCDIHTITLPLLLVHDMHEVQIFVFLFLYVTFF